MPIIEFSPQKCFDAFAEHMRQLVAATITDRHPLLPEYDETGRRMVLGFREARPCTVPLDTAYGRVYFYLGQGLEAVEDRGGFRLTTRQYWYRVQHDASFGSQAILRWEYDRATEADRHARHHAHVQITIPFGDRELDLDKAHLPTGWVTIEEVIRFLIVELGVTPPCGLNEWPDVLAESERRFYEDFTGKRYRPEC